MPKHQNTMHPPEDVCEILYKDNEAKFLICTQYPSIRRKAQQELLAYRASASCEGYRDAKKDYEDALTNVNASTENMSSCVLANGLGGPPVEASLDSKDQHALSSFDSKAQRALCIHNNFPTYADLTVKHEILARWMSVIPLCASATSESQLNSPL